MSDIFMPIFSKKRQFGNLGEDLAEVFLVKEGYKILERNYLKKWGELDVVAKKDDLVHFIEVKSKSLNLSSVTRENIDKSVSQEVSHNCFTQKDFKIKLSRVTDMASDKGLDDEYNPEDNVHYWKQKRMVRAIQTYLLERNVHEDQEWQIDIITVKVDFLEKTATIKHIENVVFDI